LSRSPFWSLRFRRRRQPSFPWITGTPRLLRKLRIDELITHKLALNDINHGFELMKRGESIRSVVVYD
jgi:hypothetical protein